MHAPISRGNESNAAGTCTRRYFVYLVILQINCSSIEDLSMNTCMNVPNYTKLYLTDE